MIGDIEGRGPDPIGRQAVIEQGMGVPVELAGRHHDVPRATEGEEDRGDRGHAAGKGLGQLRSLELGHCGFERVDRGVGPAAVDVAGADLVLRRLCERIDVREGVGGREVEPRTQRLPRLRRREGRMDGAGGERRAGGRPVRQRCTTGQVRVRVIPSTD